MCGPDEKKISRARQLRRDATTVERRLWSQLCNRQLEGHKFVRQYPIGPFFADFACREAKLVIELDGGQHADSATDAGRTAYLKAQGYRVLRFWNNDVWENIDGVVDTILAVLKESNSGKAAPHPPVAARRAPPSPR
jgi:very-short-patch-repair endonuclease